MYGYGQKTIARRSFIAVVALVAGLTPTLALAATVTAFSYDPTRTSVYYSFTTDVGFDAFRVIVKDFATGAVVGTRGGHPHYATTSISGRITGLTPGTHYWLIVKIKWVHGGSWTTERAVDFWTNP